VGERLSALEKKAHEANERLRRLDKLVEDGVTEMDDVLMDRITALKADRDHAQAALDRVRAGGHEASRRPQPPSSVEPFGQTVRERLTTGEVPFRKAYLRSIVDRVEVDDREYQDRWPQGRAEQVVLANGGLVPGVRSLSGPRQRC
jgi:site-specific DNA recombinase